MGSASAVVSGGEGNTGKASGTQVPAPGHYVLGNRARVLARR